MDNGKPGLGEIVTVEDGVVRADASPYFVSMTWESVNGCRHTESITRYADGAVISSVEKTDRVTGDSVHLDVEPARLERYFGLFKGINRGIDMLLQAYENGEPRRMLNINTEPALLR